jgi:hypothetical protein
MRFTLLFGFLLIYLSVSSQEPGKSSFFDKLYQQDSIDLTLTYPFDSLYKNNNGEIEAFITIRTGHQTWIDDEPLTLSLRGKFRRMKCSFPPLLLNFKKSMLKRMELANIDQVKLVTHCIEGEEGEENLEEERLLYQVYESVTPYAFRTIWVTVRYCDTAHPEKCNAYSGFLLEPDEVLSKRLGVVEKKTFNVYEDSIDLESYGNTAAFNFMIGNRDWSVKANRNAKLFYNPASGKYIVIPYDFDYSNVVGASYRKENYPKSMSNTYDRIYEGEYFKDRSGDMLKTFATHQSSVLSAVTTSINPMDEIHRRRIARYFDLWFKMVENKETTTLCYGKVLPYKGGL